jgi:hypothetical protein
MMIAPDEERIGVLNPGHAWIYRSPRTLLTKTCAASSVDSLQ